MTDYHEPPDELAPAARDAHRALNSLKEEIEAVDWYHQRLELAADPSLREVLAHNRDEEIEHACMTLEWLRRNMPRWDEQLREHLFQEGPIVHEHVEGKATSDSTAPAARPASGRGLGLGSLKQKTEQP
jgi:ferritin-like protein